MPNVPSRVTGATMKGTCHGTSAGTVAVRRRRGASRRARADRRPLTRYPPLTDVSDGSSATSRVPVVGWRYAAALTTDRAPIVSVPALSRPSPVTSSTPASTTTVPSLSKGASMPVRPWERFVSVPVLTRVPAPRTRASVTISSVPALTSEPGASRVISTGGGSPARDGALLDAQDVAAGEREAAAGARADAQLAAGRDRGRGGAREDAAAQVEQPGHGARAAARERAAVDDGGPARARRRG